MSPKGIKTRKSTKPSVALGPHEGTCGARNRSGGYCRKPLGAGTTHVGQGRCKLHGGASPIRHGRYSTIQRDSIRLLLEKHEADPDPLNILPELAAARAFFEDFVNRYDEWREAILSWWQSWSLSRRRWTTEEVEAFRGLVDDCEDRGRSEGDLTDRQESAIALARSFLEALSGGDLESRPRQILDVSAAHTMLAEITKIVERIERIRSANAISRPDLLRVMAEMGRVVEAHVSDEQARNRITEGWLAIRVA